MAESDNGKALEDVGDIPSWHVLSVDQTLDRLGSSTAGLTQAEAGDRLGAHGANRLTRAKRRSAIVRLLGQFTNTLVVILIVTAVVMIAIGEWLDAAVVAALVVVNAAIGFVQEGRAQQALEAVRRSVAPEAMVIRDGRQRTVPAEELVPGDLIALMSGSLVPADLRVIEARGLEIQEAALTGEALPVGKAARPIAEDTALAEKSNMAWSGTIVARGIGRGVVTATGDATEIGRIGRMLAGPDIGKTALSRQLARFSRKLTVIILLLAAGVFAVGTGLRDMATVETFRAAVGLAIAAVPEALPAILTISMAVGVTRMAKRHAIIRKLPAVEALGSVDIICADKTGTITKNQLTVRTVVTACARYEVGGVGLAADGDIRRMDPAGRDNGQGIDPDEPFRDLTHGAWAAGEARLRREDDHYVIEGDLTDGALLIFAAKQGLDPDHAGDKRVALIPYEADRQYMASLNADDAGRMIWLKGAPERILELSTIEAVSGGTTPIDRAAWEKRIESLAAEGERVLAVACKQATGDHLDPDMAEAGDFTLLGIVGMIDLARPEARDSIAMARAAGIEVKMITGDHPVTARAIAASVGLEGITVAGPELDRLDDRDFARAAREATIIARATPEHKQRLIQALQDGGKSVAMTGDGFNDAPALQKADVGIAMGGHGTEAAREASDMVLADDNFASIVAAVKEGRTVYENIRKAVAYILPHSFGEAGLIILAVMIGQPLPITALQILWINFVTETTLSVAIAFDRGESDLMLRKPRPHHEPLLTRFLIWRIAFVASLITLGGWMLFQFFLNEASVELARTVVVNALVAGEIAYLINCRRLRLPVDWQSLTGNRIVPVVIAILLALQLLFTYAEFMHDLFGSVPLGLREWTLVIGAGLALFVIVELEKRVTRHWFDERD